MRQAQARPMIVRLTKLYALIRTCQWNTRRLAEYFETSEKTILRDIEFLRDQIGLPIVCHNFKKPGQPCHWTTDLTVKLPWWL
jgi:predicted DNA-binding transcriptional regulator YafY